MRNIAKAALTFLVLTAPRAAGAVEISLISGATPAVIVTGSFQFKDEIAFRDKTASLTSAVVIFNSPGGNLLAGIEIGTTIRMKGFATAVTDGSVCASACAFAWLGGSKRLMQPRARVGFHAVSALVDGQSRESSGGNALAGAYLNRIGMSDRAVLYITETPSASIRWMSPSDAAENGIAVSIIPSTVASAQSTASTMPPIGLTPSPVPSDPVVTQKVAARLAGNFSKRYREAGMVGINTSINACYQQARATRKPEIVTYCVALDALSAGFDEAMMRQMQRPQDGTNTFQAVYARSHDLFGSLGLNEGAEIEKATKIASVALKSITATSGEAAPPETASPVLSQTADDAEARLRTRCSQLADERQLHGEERRAFRATCKAGG